jgi:hypothetical protein
MNRSNWLLTGLALVQLALMAVVFGLAGRPATLASGPLLSDFTTDSVSAVTLTNDAGTTLRLEKKADAWVLPEAEDFPAKGDAVESLLGRLAGLQSQGLIAHTASSYPRLSVADDSFLAKVDLEGGDKTTTLYVGSSPRGGVSHVRVSGAAEVYLSGISSSDVRAESSAWIDTSYLSLNPDEVVAVRLQNTQGSFNFEKVDGTWTMQGLDNEQTFDAENFDALVRQVSTLRMEKPLGKENKPEYGLDTPQATLTLTVQPPAAEATPDETNFETTPAPETVPPDTTSETTDETTTGDGASNEAATDKAEEASSPEPKTYTLTIGPQGEDTYIVRSSESEYVVAVSSSSLDSFVENDQAAFLVQENEPEPQ